MYIDAESMQHARPLKGLSALGDYLELFGALFDSFSDPTNVLTCSKLHRTLHVFPAMYFATSRVALQAGARTQNRNSNLSNFHPRQKANHTINKFYRGLISNSYGTGVENLKNESNIMVLGPTTMINGVELTYATPFIIVAGPQNMIFYSFLRFSTPVPHELEMSALQPYL